MLTPRPSEWSWKDVDHAEGLWSGVRQCELWSLGAAGAAAPVGGACSLRGRSDCRLVMQRCCSLLHEMFEGRNPPPCCSPISNIKAGREVRCLFVAGRVPEMQLFVSARSRARDTTAPKGRPFRQPGWGHRSGQKEGVHNVHTLGYGSGRVMSPDMGDSSASGHR